MQEQQPSEQGGVRAPIPGRRIAIIGPPRRAAPDNIATPYELPLNDRPSNDWARAFQSFDWRRAGAPKRPVLDKDVIRVAWFDNEASMRGLLDAVKAGIAEINDQIAREDAERQQAAAEEARRAAEEEATRQEVLDHWWQEQGGDG